MKLKVNKIPRKYQKWTHWGGIFACVFLLEDIWAALALNEKPVLLWFTFFSTLRVNYYCIRMTHLFGLVATPHVLSDVLDTFYGLFDLRWHHREGDHCVDALWSQLTRHLPQIWRIWGLLPVLAGAGAFLSCAALHGRELTVPKLKTVKGTSSDLLGITARGVIHFHTLLQLKVDIFS